MRLRCPLVAGTLTNVAREARVGLSLAQRCETFTSSRCAKSMTSSVVPNDLFCHRQDSAVITFKVKKIENWRSARGHEVVPRREPWHLRYRIRAPGMDSSRKLIDPEALWSCRRGEKRSWALIPKSSNCEVPNSAGLREIAAALGIWVFYDKILYQTALPKKSAKESRIRRFIRSLPLT